MSPTALDLRHRLDELNRARAARIAPLPPLSRTSKPTADEIETLAGIHADAGLRPFPYPFRSAFAITSDIDRSNKSNYLACARQLVGQAGLDFGDSIWLGSNFAGSFPGVFLLTPWLGFPGTVPDDQLDFWDLLREHHLGNVDHWHSFVRRGPRFAIIDALEQRGEDVVVGTPKPPSNQPSILFSIESFFVLGALVHGQWTGDDPVAAVEIKQARGATITLTSARTPFPLPGDEGEVRQQLLIWDRPPESGEHPALLANVRGVVVRLRSGRRATLSRVLLLNLYPGLIQSRLSWLQSRYHWSTNVITRHGHWHFNDELGSAAAARVQGQRSLDRLEEFPDEMESYIGSLLDAPLRCSTVADEPGSFARVYPDIVRDHGLRYARVDAHGYPCRRLLHEPDGFHPSVFDLVFPGSTRHDGFLYLVRSTKSSITPEEADRLGLPNRGSAERSTFPTTLLTLRRRVDQVLDELEREPGRASVFYTHIGNLMPTDVPPSPYVDETLVRRLQTHAFGLGTTSPRVWFTRASVLAEYCAIAQTLGAAIERDENDPDTVRITSWEDPFLGTPMATHAGQLYGQTIYVERSATARVLLDGEEIRELVRNPADDTGRESVTIACCAIRHTLFRNRDPLGVCKARLDGVEARWTPSRDDAFGILELSRKIRTATDATASLPVGRATIDPVEITPDGCQHLTFFARRSAGARLGILLETIAGGRFFFGDESLREDAGPLHAWYPLPPAMRTTDDGWACCTVPFHGLTWSHDLPTPLPVPSHPPRAATFMLGGPRDARIEYAAVEYGRPKTTIPGAPRPGLCIGGRAGKGVRVELTSRDDARTSQTTTADDRGGFVFDDVKPGVHQIRSTRRNVVEVECFADRFDIDLTADKRGR